MFRTTSLTALTLALSLAAIPAAGQQWRCFPSCDSTDGRLIGTSAGGFANTSQAASARFEFLFTLPPSASEIRVGLFDPDDRGLIDGQFPGDAVGTWDADFDSEPMVLRYRLCTDPDNDYVCNTVLFDALSTDAALAAADNAWHDLVFATDPAAAAPSGALHYILLVEQATVEPGDLRWNMFKVRAAEPATIFMPKQLFAFGVPMISMGEASILYPSGFGDLSVTTYDGTWEFSTEVAPSSLRSGEEAEALVFWDGDFDYGSPNVELPRPLPENATACYLAGLPVAGQFDSDDPNTDTTAPPFLDGSDPSFRAEGGGASTEIVEGVPMDCYEMGSPPDNWVFDDPTADFGIFKRETVTLGSNSCYQVIDPLGRTFDNANPSGNREYEKFVVSAASDCDADASDGSANADHCVTGELPAGPWRIRFEGIDVTNINHFYGSICIGDENGFCLPSECGDCDGKITQMTLKYNGAVPALVRVTEQGGGEVFPATLLQPDAVFNIVGSFKKGTFGTKITIYVNGLQHTEIHTSCSDPVGPGWIAGDFEVLRSYSRNGGEMCPYFPPEAAAPARQRRRPGRSLEDGGRDQDPPVATWSPGSGPRRRGR